MDKTFILKHLSDFLDPAVKNQQWGHIEFEVRAGEPVCTRTSFTNKLTGANNRGREYEAR